MWFEVIGPDAAALHKFYKDVFSWKLTPPVKEMGNYSMVQGHEPGIGGGVGGGEVGERRVTVYIESAEPQRLLDKALAAGATLLMPVTTITPDTTIAMFTDPAGNTIGLMKANPAAAARRAASGGAASSRTAQPRAKAASGSSTKTATRGRKTAATKKTSTKRKATKRAKRR
jgi:predicted enzyme related to lactoylglutathione lyase